MFTIYANYKNEVYLRGRIGLGSTDDFKLIMKDIPIDKIARGREHVLIYDKHKNLWCMGYNTCGQLGLGHFRVETKPTLILQDSEIKQIYSGRHHSMFIKNNGEVWGFGCNIGNQLGIEDHCDHSNFNKPVFIMKDSNIKFISLGDTHSILYKNNGEVWGFGDNGSGQLGIGKYSIEVNPILIMTDLDIKGITCSDDFTYMYKNTG